MLKNNNNFKKTAFIFLFKENEICKKIRKIEIKTRGFSQKISQAE